jgi:hypothetical protein
MPLRVVIAVRQEGKFAFPEELGSMDGLGMYAHRVLTVSGLFVHSRCVVHLRLACQRALSSTKIITVLFEPSQRQNSSSLGPCDFFLQDSSVGVDYG